ncbi:putative serine/threonine protein phosphatase [Escherichia phage A4]|nr:putative serine/threonine protein phosphatase [Escherichia phage A4]
MKHFLEVTVPDEKDLYIVGDIHGNAKLWEHTKKEFGITPEDYVFSLGDLIDRGEQSAHLLFEFLFAENRYMIMGNHESMCIDSATHRDWYHCWTQNGGDKFLEEVGVSGVEFFRQYLDQLPMIIQINHRGLKIGLVHAGVDLKYNDWNKFITGTKSMSSDTIESCLWDRKTFDFCKANNVFNASRITNVDYVLSGHTAVFDPLIYGNRIWIDSQFLTGDLTIATPQGGKMRYLRKEKDEYSFSRFKR